FAAGGLRAQYAYQLFHPDVQYLYEQPVLYQPPLSSYSGQPLLLGMKLNGDDCAEAYPSLSVAPGYCLEVVPSFAGYEVCQREDSTWLDFRELGRMLLLPTATVGREWTAMATDTGAIRARVTEVALTDFLGFTDSVKSITLYYADSEVPIGEPVRISKQYGLITAKLFWSVAELGHLTLELAGMDEPFAGLQDFTSADVLDVQTGDEWHYETSAINHGTSDYDPVREVWSYYTQFHHVKATVEEISVTDEAVSVLLRGEAISYKVDPDRSPTNYDSAFVEDYQETRRLPLSQLADYDRQPGSLVFDTSQYGVSYYQLLMTEGSCGSAEKWLSSLIRVDEGCDFDHTAVDGGSRTHSTQPFALGGWGHVGGQGGNYSSRLDYRRRGKSETCGTPYDFSDIVISVDEAFNRDMAVFPNPVAERLTVSLPYANPAMQLILFDLHGRRVLEQNARLSNQLATETLLAGVYVLVVRDKRQMLARRKIIIR
ncbi:MAG: T9SS type A sorting domain-containing protein, partial [Bacteroidota bacterium]